MKGKDVRAVMSLVDALEQARLASSAASTDLLWAKNRLRDREAGKTSEYTSLEPKTKALQDEVKETDAKCRQANAAVTDARNALVDLLYEIGGPS
jgi:chromosome segregation ATPase